MKGVGGEETNSLSSLLFPHSSTHTDISGISGVNVEIRTVEVSRLQAAAYNPRIVLEPGMPGYERLKRSIDEFGLKVRYYGGISAVDTSFVTKVDGA